jgi:hypothetical protein
LDHNSKTFSPSSTFPSCPKPDFSTKIPASR